MKLPAATAGNGEWRLVVSDHAALDVGTVDAWSIELGSGANLRTGDAVMYTVGDGGGAADGGRGRRGVDQPQPHPFVRPQLEPLVRAGGLAVDRDRVAQAAAAAEVARPDVRLQHHAQSAAVRRVDLGRHVGQVLEAGAGVHAHIFRRLGPIETGRGKPADALEVVVTLGGHPGNAFLATAQEVMHGRRQELAPAAE